MSLHLFKTTSLNAYTFLYVGFFKLMGKKLSVGKRTIIYPGARVLPNNGEISLGENCFILPQSVIQAYDGFVRIGNDVTVNYQTILYGHGGLTVGDGTRIAAQVLVIPANHGFDDRDTPIHRQPLVHRGITIGKDVWIGAGAKILDGVHIADGSVIGANAVVTKNTQAHSINVGVPARQTGMRGIEKAS